MRVLLDTHVFLWFITGSSHLSPAARKILENQETTALLSVASVWELAIKYSLGRLDIVGDFHSLISQQLDAAAVTTLPLTITQCTRIAYLPFHHRDPFDRIIVVQAQDNGIPLMSADRILGQYDVEIIW